jgi:hypothetical protein
MIFKYYSFDQINEVREAECVPSVMKKNLSETI